MASVAIVIHKAPGSSVIADLEILGPKIGNVPCIELPDVVRPHRQQAKDWPRWSGQAAMLFSDRPG